MSCHFLTSVVYKKYYFKQFFFFRNDLSIQLVKLPLANYHHVWIYGGFWYTTLTLYNIYCYHYWLIKFFAEWYWFYLGFLSYDQSCSLGSQINKPSETWQFLFSFSRKLSYKNIYLWGENTTGLQKSVFIAQS